MGHGLAEPITGTNDQANIDADFIAALVQNLAKSGLME